MHMGTKSTRYVKTCVICYNSSANKTTIGIGEKQYKQQNGLKRETQIYIDIDCLRQNIGDLKGGPVLLSSELTGGPVLLSSGINNGTLTYNACCGWSH